MNFAEALAELHTRIERDEYPDLSSDAVLYLFDEFIADGETPRMALVLVGLANNGDIGGDGCEEHF